MSRPTVDEIKELGVKELHGFGRAKRLPLLTGIITRKHWERPPVQLYSLGKRRVVRRVMRRYKTETRRNRPGLLLWFLPYFVLSLLSGGAHNHAQPGLASSPFSFVHSHPYAADGVSAHDHIAEEIGACHTTRLMEVESSHLHAHSHLECLACHWASQSVAHPKAPSQLLPPAPDTLQRPPFSFAYSFQFPSGQRTRGPPLS